MKDHPAWKCRNVTATAALLSPFLQVAFACARMLLQSCACSCWPFTGARDQDSVVIHMIEGPASLKGAAAPTTICGTLQPLHKVQTWTVVWHAVSPGKKIQLAQPTLNRIPSVHWSQASQQLPPSCSARYFFHGSHAVWMDPCNIL